MQITAYPTEFRNRYGCPLAAAKAVAVQAAATTYLQPDTRESEALLEIGSRADSGSYGRSASDLGALVSGIIANYGSETNSTAESGESEQAANRVADSRRASSESVSGLQRTGYATEELRRDAETLEPEASAQPLQRSVAHGVRGAQVSAEQEVDLAGSDVAQAERELDCAQRFQPGSQDDALCPQERAKQERDKKLVLAAAEEYLKKAAARDAAARLRRALASLTSDLAEEHLSPAERPNSLELAQFGAE